MLSENKLVELRRHLHRHPELSNQETETAEFIENQLREFGIENIKRVSETGVVALIEGQDSGPVLAWRADIDALPIQEKNDIPYKSSNEGVMHACGHDVHTTIGLGLAEELHSNRDRLSGSVKIIFQPAEEASPEDAPVGAERMAQDGVLKDPAVDGMFATHCMPDLAAGKIGHTGRDVWAGSALVEIEVSGTKSHGAYPHQGVDSVYIGSKIVTTLQSVFSRRIDARQACVLSFGAFEAGNAYNVLAERASLTGTLRTFSEDVAERAKESIQRITQNVAEGLGAVADVTFTPGARPVLNNPDLEKKATDVLKEDGREIVTKHESQMGAEDFAAFSRRVPACYLFLGVKKDNQVRALHTPTFDVDESCLAFGVRHFSQMLFRLAGRMS